MPHGYPALILIAKSTAYVDSNPTRVTLWRYFVGFVHTLFFELIGGSGTKISRS